MIKFVFTYVSYVLHNVTCAVFHDRIIELAFIRLIIVYVVLFLSDESGVRSKTFFSIFPKLQNRQLCGSSIERFNW